MNVRSGPGRRTKYTHVVELLHENGIDARVFPAASGGAIRSHAEDAVAQGYTTLVAGGGDGTVGIVAGVASSANATLGILPLGTFNHFARDLRIPTDIAEAVATLRSMRRTKVDIASVNGRPFVNTSSIGLYPKLVLEKEHYRREGLSHWLASLTAAFRTLRDFRNFSVRLTANGRQWTIRTPFVFVGNNPYVLEGNRIGSRASLVDGVLFVCTAAAASRWQLIKMVVQAWFGHIRENPDFQALTATEFWVESRWRRLYVSRDGEVDLMHTPLRYVTHAASLSVIVP